MLRPILRYGERPLHQPASTVTVFDDDIQRLVDDMIETMYAAPGIGLAATRLASPCAYSSSISQWATTRRNSSSWSIRRLPNARGCSSKRKAASAYPASMPPSFARRASSWMGSTGMERPRRLEGNGLLARAFQHEMDHLDGMVFVDRLRGIKRDLIVRKIQKLKRSGKW